MSQDTIQTVLVKQNVQFVQKDHSVKIRPISQKNVKMAFTVLKAIPHVVSAQLDINAQMVFLLKHALRVSMHQQAQRHASLALLVQNVLIKEWLTQLLALLAHIPTLQDRYLALIVKQGIAVLIKMLLHYVLLVILVDMAKLVAHHVALETIARQEQLYASLVLLDNSV